MWLVSLGSLDGYPDLATVDLDVSGGRYREPNAIASNLGDCYRDVVADTDDFVLFASKY